VSYNHFISFIWIRQYWPCTEN